jgi:hypothetical protein
MNNNVNQRNILLRSMKLLVKANVWLDCSAILLVNVARQPALVKVFGWFVGNVMV